jgi:hypothetical protein
MLHLSDITKYLPGQQRTRILEKRDICRIENLKAKTYIEQLA